MQRLWNKKQDNLCEIGEILLTKLNDYWEYQDYYFELARALHRNPIPYLYNRGESEDKMHMGKINYDF